MTAANRKSLIVIPIGVSLRLAIGLISYVLFQQRKRDEALAKRLIVKFHERYNSNEPDSTSEYGFLVADKMQSERIHLGKFLGVTHCAVQRLAEPPWLKTECFSSFKNGYAKELFILQHDPGDSHLLVYPVKSE
jgi:hypothetical protein